MRFKVQFDYRNDYTTLKAGEVVDLPRAEAEWLNRDAPGLLVEARSPDQPPADRQVRSGKRRASSGREGEGTD